MGEKLAIFRHHDLPLGILPLFTPVAAICCHWLDDYCGFKREVKLQPFAKVKRAEADDCLLKSGMYLVFRVRGFLPTVNMSCAHNSYYALTSRGFGLQYFAKKPYTLDPLVVGPIMDDNFNSLWFKLEHELNRIGQPTCCLPDFEITKTEWLARYPKLARDKMQQEILTSDYNTKLTLNCFVKSELIPTYDETKNSYGYKQIDPRLITVPPSWYRIGIGPQAHYFGKLIAAAWCKHYWIVYASGLNPEDLGEVVNEFLFRGYGIVVSGDDILIYHKFKWHWFDASRFDMHVRARAIVMTRTWLFHVLSKHNPVDPKLVDFIIKNSITKRYKDRFGNKAQGIGTRGSGEFDTSSINSVIEASPAIGAMLEGRTPTPLDWLNIGFVVEGGSSDRLEDADFLSRIFLPMEEGWLAALKAGRIVVKTGWSRHYYHKRKHIHGYIRGLLIGLRNDLLSHPILEGLYQLINQCDDVPPIFTSTALELEFELHATKIHKYNDQTWYSLAYRYSLPVMVLKQLRTELHELRLGGELVHPAWRRVIHRDLS